MNKTTFMEETFMDTISQKQAVVNAVSQVLGSNFDRTAPARNQLSDDQMTSVKTFVFNAITSGSVEYSKDISNEKEVSKKALQFFLKNLTREEYQSLPVEVSDALKQRLVNNK